MKPSIVALVPMRHHSTRVPGKNYRLFAGKPLYHHILHALLACSLIERVVVDTDSEVIKEGLLKSFPGVQLIDRPENLRAGTVPMNDVLLHDAALVKADCYLQTHSTNPLLRTETITRAIQLFLESYPTYDSLFSVTRIQTRLWDCVGRPINHDPAVLLRTQDLTPVYEENSCLYIFTSATLDKKQNRIGNRPLLFEIDQSEAWDIDEEVDFKLAEFLYNERQKSKAGDVS